MKCLPRSPCFYLELLEPMKTQFSAHPLHHLLLRPKASVGLGWPFLSMCLTANTFWYTADIFKLESPCSAKPHSRNTPVSSLAHILVWPAGQFCVISLRFLQWVPTYLVQHYWLNCGTIFVYKSHCISQLGSGAKVKSCIL